MYDSLLCVVHSAAAMAYLTYPVAVSLLSLRLHAADSLLPYYSTITYRYSFVFAPAFPYASALNSVLAIMMPGTLTRECVLQEPFGLLDAGGAPWYYILK